MICRHGPRSNVFGKSPKVSNRGQMLKIHRSSNGKVIFRLAGRLNEELVAEMEALLRSEAATREIVLDLKDPDLGRS